VIDLSSALSYRDSADLTEPLTTREGEVARLVAEGMTNREIAGSLCVSVRTVESHVDGALSKLGLHNRTRLAAWVSRGWASAILEGS
jgi:DNA-binding NarL/FixJ family response regulator